MIYKHLYTRLQARYPAALWHGDPQRREIALTFDDGPDSAATPALLALLDELQVRATFFHIGQRAQRAPALVRQVADAGHQIGLHSYAHRSFWLHSPTSLLADLARTQAVLAAATGRPAATFTAVRPPFGHVNRRTVQTLFAAGYLPAMWSVVPFHWVIGRAATLRRLAAGAANGAIFVLHERMRGPALPDLVADALPDLLANGYRFVTIAELWERRRASNL